ncbi:MAG: hypothetical protein AAFP76_08415 [Bacteroidota bacterium]
MSTINSYRDGPGGRVLKPSNWEELYALTRHWKSDMEFYRDDLRFLHKLIDRYFIWITKEENVDSVRKIENGLLNLERRCRDLLAKVSKHLSQLGRVIEEPEMDMSHIFQVEHGHLEDALAVFVKDVRQHRKEVFRITELVADSEQLRKAFET